MNLVSCSKGKASWRLALALSVLGGAVDALAEAPPAGSESPPQPPALIPIVVSFVLNGMPQGDVFPLVRDTDVLMPASDLVESGIDLARLSARMETIDGQTYVSLESLQPMGTFRLDADTATLSCELPATVFGETRVDLGVHPPPGYVVKGSPSGFLNYAVHARNLDFTMFGEAGASVGRGLLTTQMRWHPGTQPLRGLSQLTVDFPEHMVRAIAGESSAFGGVLGGGAVVAGVHLLRSFDLNPYFIQSPVREFAGDVTTPSTLEVYVNNQLVRRTDLPPGPFRLENLTVPRGEGTTRYVVRDAFGRVREVQGSYYLGGQLLAPGLLDYRASLGVERTHLGARSFSYGDPMLLASARMGWKAWLTPGVRLEVSPALVSAGASQLMQLPLGEVELSQGLSRGEKRGGGALGAVYGLQGRWVGGTLFGRWMSAHYGNIGLYPHEDRPRLETGGSLYVAVGSRVSLGGQVVVSRWRDREHSTWLSATTTARLSDRATLSFTANHGLLSDGSSSLDGMLYLNAVLDGRTIASVGHARGSNKPLTNVDVARGVPLDGGWGFQVQGQAGGAAYARGRVDYDTDIGRYAGGAEWQDGRVVGAAEVAGGLVAIGGRVHATRVVDNGFALVRVDGVKGVGVHLNNHLVGRTDSQGEYVVTRLQAYNANRLSLSDGELPLDVYLPTTEQLVTPWLRGGVVLEFQAESVRAFRGRLVLTSADPSRSLAYGELHVSEKGRTWTSPLGHGGEFELVGLSPGRHSATVIYPGGRCAATLDVPSLEEMVIDLGEMRCMDEAAR
ncbi:fimbria/pilus outer membrane usher protein [Myxococcus sp. K15C18031901]|uniref:fimbria/pilus outer membrane usher protein n=1 Tax=Myxococcus dinghuensis TaxID=2906761 RepID=UPI0020A7D0CB|nr:fimbria/pilus outer membrane usher protein [Myxococcus dinghuensis]MCP3101383.1 fimbria/pilus outer membrane usher protein [Myxococcus dinghuensis]